MIIKLDEFLNENNRYDDFFITYDKDRFVCHITSQKNAEIIKKYGFKTGKELNISEKRSAIYFADKSVNYNLYARNREGEIYEGEEIGEVCVNIKGLKLLNLSYKEKDIFVNHKKYNKYVVKGELDKIPFDIDGTISYLKDGRIFEVCLYKKIANRLIK